MNASPIILFDGVCNLCNGAVNFIIRQDKNNHFRFAALQSDAGQELLQQFHLPQEVFHSFILIDHNKVYQKSAAALKVAAYLPPYWMWVQLFWIVPRFLRDVVYDVIAKNRYRWFGKKDACLIPTPELRSRFLS